MRTAQLRRELKSLRGELGKSRLGKGKVDDLFPHPEVRDNFLRPGLRRVGPKPTQEDEIGPKRFIPKPIIPNESPHPPLRDRLQSEDTDDSLRREHVDRAESFLDRVEGTIQKANDLLTQAEREIIQAREPWLGGPPRRWG